MTRLEAARGRRPVKRLICLASSCAVGLPTAVDARAAGFGLDVQSGRGTGMASAVTGFVDDSSAVFYNAAGIAQGRSLDAQMGGTLIMPSFTFTPKAGPSVGNSFKAAPLVQAFVSGGVTDHLSLGIGIFTPYGLVLAWPDGWVGKSIVTEVELATFDLNPTVAYRLGPVRVGAGMQIVRATIDEKKKIETGIQEVSSELGGGAWGVGANVGVQVEAIPQYLTFGAHYRSQVDLDISGNASFSNVPVAFQSSLHDQAASTGFTLPDTLALAVASRPIQPLVLDAEVVWTTWSHVKSIDVTFPNDATKTLSYSQARNWSDTVNVRAGGEYAIGDAWRVRAGILYDPTPAPDSTLAPDIPDASRINFAVGGSYVHPSGFRVDLGYQLLTLLKRSSTLPQLPGDYSAIVNLVGLSFGYGIPAR
jgi:long-chain fatty acid transport protein